MVVTLNSVDDFLNVSSSTIGICLLKTNERSGTHIGVLYHKPEENNKYFLHLAYHFHLKDELVEDIKNEAYRWVELQVDELLAPSIITSISLATERTDKHKVPYGLTFSKTKMDKSGNLELGENEVGLTCATYVLTILEHAGLTLLDLGTWRKRCKDKSLHEKFVDGLKRNRDLLFDFDNSIDDHISNIENEIGCIRYRPEEVAAGAISSELRPMKYKKCKKVGKAIFKKLPLSKA